MVQEVEAETSERAAGIPEDWVLSQTEALKKHIERVFFVRQKKKKTRPKFAKTRKISRFPLGLYHFPLKISSISQVGACFEEGRYDLARPNFSVLKHDENSTRRWSLGGTMGTKNKIPSQGPLQG